VHLHYGLDERMRISATILVSPLPVRAALPGGSYSCMENGVGHGLIVIGKMVSSWKGYNSHHLRIEMRTQGIFLISSIQAKEVEPFQLFYFRTYWQSRGALHESEPIGDVELKIDCRFRSE